MASGYERVPPSPSYQNASVPSAFICAITSEIMLDPVVTTDGQTYERTAIERWLVDHRTSPRTNARLASKDLIPNVALRQQIDDFCKATGRSPPKPYYPPPPSRRSSNRRGGGGGAAGWGQGGDVEDPCPWLPGWLVAVIFLGVWLAAWAAGEATVAREVFVALAGGEYNVATLFTFAWLLAWTAGGCIACSAMWGLCTRECLGADGDWLPGGLSGGKQGSAGAAQEMAVASVPHLTRAGLVSGTVGSARANVGA